MDIMSMSASHDSFASLFKSAVDAYPGYHPQHNVTAEVKIDSNDPFEVPCSATNMGADSRVPRLPQTLLVDAVYGAQRILGDSSSPKDNNGEREPVVMSTTRKLWLQKINGKASFPEQDIGVRGHVQASGQVGDKSTGVIRRVKVVTPENDKIQNLDPLMRIDVRRLCTAAINDEISGVDPRPFEKSDFVGSALLKPCFSPYEPGICAISTGYAVC